MNERRSEDARLVAASRAGDPEAFARLFDRWFDRCVDVAWRILHDRDAAADVAQEAFLAAWATGLRSLRDPGSFGGWVLRTARNRALDRLAHERRAVAVGDDSLARAADTGGPPRTDEVAAVVTRAEDDDLVWAASAALGERDASILDLHLRHQLAAPEIAEALGVTPNNAHQLLFRLRKRLNGAIRAWVLWRDGAPACPALAVALRAAGVTRFGPEAVRVTCGHVPDCADCDTRQHLRLAPEALFAAVPMAPVAIDARARAVAALRAEGAPAGPGPAGGDTAESGPGGGRHGEHARHARGTPRARHAPRRRRSGGPRSPGGAMRALTLTGALVVVAASVAAVAAARPQPALQAIGEAAGTAGDDPGEPAGGSSPATAGDGAAETVGDGTAGDGAAGPAGAEAGSATTGPTPPGDAGTATAAAPAAPGTVQATPDPVGPEAGAATSGEAEAGDTTPASGPTLAATEGPTDGAPAADVSPGPAPASATASTSTTTTTLGDDPTREPGGGTEEAPAAPEVVRFTATGERTPAPCAGGQRRVTLRWEATGATSTTLAGPGAPAGAQAASGSASACVTGSARAAFTVTATGPGGTASATATG